MGLNFDVQGEDHELLKHYRLQYQNGHVALVVENGTALADRREPSDVYISLQVLNYNDEGGLEFGNSPRS